MEFARPTRIAPLARRARMLEYAVRTAITLLTLALLYPLAGPAVNQLLAASYEHLAALA